ncbi:MAG TPA: hypothetical protein VF623_11190, partial [Segetibacter sp.]
MQQLEKKTTAFLRRFITLLSLVNALLILPACKKQINQEDYPFSGQASIATRWADMTLTTIKKSYYNTPTYSSRSLACMGLCLYESVVNADPTFQSLNKQLNGLNTLPSISSSNEYSWPIVLNEGQKTLLKLLYPLNENISQEYFMKIDELAEDINKKEEEKWAQATIERSSDLGRQIALAIFNWSKNDGGFEGFKRNFDPLFSLPTGLSYWVPPTKGQSPSKIPLHPLWGNNRTFVASNSLLPVPVIEKYSTVTSSNYYKLFSEVFIKGLTLNQNEKEIAAWWGDDPSQTFSPPGHSYNLVTIAIEQSNATLIKAAEAYAKVGLAVGDAFIH